jgi:hypothetical protein
VRLAQRLSRSAYLRLRACREALSFQWDLIDRDRVLTLANKMHFDALKRVEAAGGVSGTKRGRGAQNAVRVTKPPAGPLSSLPLLFEEPGRSAAAAVPTVQPLQYYMEQVDKVPRYGQHTRPATVLALRRCLLSSSFLSRSRVVFQWLFCLPFSSHSPCIGCAQPVLLRWQ